MAGAAGPRATETAAGHHQPASHKSQPLPTPLPTQTEMSLDKEEGYVVVFANAGCSLGFQSGDQSLERTSAHLGHV